MLAMKAHHRGTFVRLQRGTAGEIVENQRGLGGPSVVVIIVKRERFLTGRWHLAERADVLLPVPIARPAPLNTAERLRLRLKAGAEAARRRLVQLIRRRLRWIAR
jgi:hypothetical protein